MATLRALLPHVYLFDDCCNVYVVKNESRALLVDCGSGAVKDQLASIDVRGIDWVLFTHHHRDQCYGAMELVAKGTKLAVPHYERFLFERAADYWQQKRIYDNYNDRNTFFTLGHDLPVAQSLPDYEKFVWGPYSFYILPTPGHSLGSITLISDIDDTRVAFTGDLMYDGGKLYQLHAMEYDYGDMAGANWVGQSLHALRKKNVQLVLPSHGPVIQNPAECIEQLDQRLHSMMSFHRDRMGGSPDGVFAHEIKMESITPHLLWGTEATCSNFYVIRADSGKSMLIDYPYASSGLFGRALHSPEPFTTVRFIEHHLDELREAHGVRSFDVVIPTHIHDDHVCGIPYLQRHHATKCWALEQVAVILEAPQKWNTPCLLEPTITIDRRFQDGDRFEWEGIKFEIVFYPGQTEFHSAILAELDGRRVLFVGDSSYPLKRYQPDKQSEWMVNTVLRNSLTLAMHRKCADEFERLRPDLLCCGHGPVWDVPPEAYAEHRRYIERKEALWRDLLPEPADLGIDLFWARLIPYQAKIARGDTSAFVLELRNPLESETVFEASLYSAIKLRITPPKRTLTLAPGATGRLTFKVTAPPDSWHHPYRRHVITADIRAGKTSYGPVTEALLVITQ